MAHDKEVEAAAGGGKAIFIGIKRQAQEAVATEAERARAVLRDQPLDGRHPHQLLHPLPGFRKRLVRTNLGTGA